MEAAGLAVMAGDAFPIYLRGRGGKAVASFTGAFLYLTPLPVAATAVVFVVMVAATRHISVGSVAGAGAFPLAVWMISHPPLPVMLAAIASGVFIIYRHRDNLQRLRTGTENVFSLRGSRR